MFQPRGRIEFVQNNLAGKFDERYRHRGWVLASDHNAGAFVPHFADHFDQPSNQVSTIDIFVRLVEDNQLVKRLFHATGVAVCGVSEELQQDDKQTECFIFFDKLIAEIDNDKPPWADERFEAPVVVN